MAIAELVRAPLVTNFARGEQELSVVDELREIMTNGAKRRLVLEDSLVQVLPHEITDGVQQSCLPFTIVQTPSKPEGTITSASATATGTIGGAGPYRG